MGLAPWAMSEAQRSIATSMTEELLANIRVVKRAIEKSPDKAEEVRREAFLLTKSAKKADEITAKFMLDKATHDSKNTRA